MNAKTISLLTDGAALTAYLGRITVQSRKVADMIQLAAASGAYHAMKDGNTDPLNALIVAAGKGARKTALVQWMLTHAPVVMNDDAKADKPLKFSRDKVAELLNGESKPTAEVALAHCEKAHGFHWMDHKEPPLVPTDWSLTDAVMALVKKAKDYQGKQVNVSGADMIGMLEDMAKKSMPAPELATAGDADDDTAD